MGPRVMVPAVASTGTSSALNRLPHTCCSATMAFSSSGYATSTASSQLIGWMGPTTRPSAMMDASTMLLSRLAPAPMGSSSPAVMAIRAMVTPLYFLDLSTYPPRKMLPNMMASWKPAPVRSMVSTLSTPLRMSVSPMKALTALLMPMDTTNAISGCKNPLVCSSFHAITGKGLRSAAATSTLLAAELEGGVGGASWNCTTAPMLTAKDRNVMRLKYPFMPVSVCAITPPTMKLVAMPIWLALMAMDVATARSSLPNHVALSSVGVHWKKGCAAPTSTVPSTSCVYVGMALYGQKFSNSSPLRSAHPAVIRNPAPTTTLRRPRRATMAGSRKQKMTLVKRNTSMRVSALWWKMASQVPGVAATLKHTQSDSSASVER
mmetsp:Transcript_35846/g.88268  ORF Transcript_35846/g.88268 Transcript_35846/m.88268 type:complete len:377 (-) Transcript_35846:1236-2366(-)